MKIKQNWDDNETRANNCSVALNRVMPRRSTGHHHSEYFEGCESEEFEVEIEAASTQG